MSEKETDITELGLERMLEQFHESVKLRALAASWLDRVQDFEDAYHPLLEERSIDYATGDRLDGIGQILNLDRGGLSDDDYRLLLKAEVLVLSSDGTADTLISIAQALVQMPVAEYEVRDYYPKGFYLRPVDYVLTVNAQSVGGALKRAKPAGTTMLFVYSLYRDIETFSFSSLPSTAQSSAAIGFADDAQTTGGHLAGTV